MGRIAGQRVWFFSVRNHIEREIRQGCEHQFHSDLLKRIVGGRTIERSNESHDDDPVDRGQHKTDRRTALEVA